MEKDNRLTRWQRFDDIFRSFDEFFGNIGMPHTNSLSTTDKKFWMLRELEDVEDIDGGKRISIAVPGRTKDNIEITVEDDSLKISAKKTESVIGRLVHSFCSNEFCTIYDISQYDKDSIDARVENGILTIDLKYKDVPKSSSHKVEIK